jgi:hypothetical protein
VDEREDQEVSFMRGQPLAHNLWTENQNFFLDAFFAVLEVEW